MRARKRPRTARVELTRGELTALTVAIDRFADACRLFGMRPSEIQQRDLERAQRCITAALIRSCQPPKT